MCGECSACGGGRAGIRGLVVWPWAAMRGVDVRVWACVHVLARAPVRWCACVCVRADMFEHGSWPVCG